MPRPTQPILSTRNITDAALDAVDATGDFTMPGIAKQLNVTPSSLYTHISGRSEIVELMRIRVMSSISVPTHRQGGANGSARGGGPIAELRSSTGASSRCS